MFSFIKNKLQIIFSTVTSKLGSFFSRTTIDEAALKELEILLISSDVGVATTRFIIAALCKRIEMGEVDGAQLKKYMHTILLEILTQHKAPDLNDQKVFLFVGINGSGKTTTIGKLAHQYKQQGKKILLVAADTFRAAAPEQLNQWALQIGVDILIIDTAGRLQTKINLMHELAKIKRCVQKQLPDQSVVTLLTIDAMLGQNSFEQAKLFKESTDVTGIILTKMDGTGKGGIVFAIAQELAIPVLFMTFGEQSDQIKAFDAHEYVTELLG